jgi:MFS family permease
MALPPMHTPDVRPSTWRAGSSAWLARWRPILPLLGAELAVWLGFGALLPVMPLYFRGHGVDLVTLGLIVAAWPAARLIAEPVFGWIADRTARVPLMLGGLLLTAVTVALPVVVTAPLAFLVLRALSGIGAAAYDPAARGFLVDATPQARRGEAFGLYAGAQMSGFLIGPGIGGVAAAITGDVSVVFILCAMAILAGAAAVAIWVHEPEPGQARHEPVPPRTGIAGVPADEPILSVHAVEDRDDQALAPEGLAPHGHRAGDVAADAGPGDGPAEATGSEERRTGDAVPAGPPSGARVPDAAPRPRPGSAPARLWNPLLLTAIILQVGSFFSGGVYEVVWSVYLDHLGAGLAFIAITWAAFGLPVPFLSPLAGRWVDRRGPLPFLVIGSIVPAVAGLLYTVVTVPVLFLPIGFLEGAAFALLSPALYALAAAGSPPGRVSTAQGILGAAGTVGTILASVTAGYLAAADLRLPFWAFSAVMVACLVLALAIGTRAMMSLAPDPDAHDLAAEA